MKILQICFRPPYPLKDGGAIAMYRLSQGLIQNNVQLTLLIPVTEKHPEPQIPAYDPVFSNARAFFVPLNTRITFRGTLSNFLFSRKPYYLSRYFNKAFEKELISILKQNSFDWIIIESLKMAGYVRVIRQFSSAGIVLRSHNAEFLIWQRTADVTNHIIKKYYLKNLTKRLRREEKNLSCQFDAVLSITEVDAKIFKEMGINVPMYVLPTGLDTLYEAHNVYPEPYSAFHLGAMDWIPNQEGIKWFIHEVWPLVQKEIPQSTFYLAGRNMPDEFYSYNQKGIKVVGEVQDAISFMYSKQIMVVPLLSGSGMRIKIIEAMAAGKAIISTPIGAEGILCKHNQNIILAEKAEEFASAIINLFKNPEKIEILGNNALQNVKNNYDNKFIVAKCLNWLNNLNKNNS